MSELLFDPVIVEGLPASDRVVLTSRGNYFLIRMTQTESDLNSDGINDQLNIKTCGWQSDQDGEIVGNNTIPGNVNSINLDAVKGEDDAITFISECITNCVLRGERMVSSRAIFNLIPKE